MYRRQIFTIHFRHNTVFVANMVVSCWRSVCQYVSFLFISILLTIIQPDTFIIKKKHPHKCRWTCCRNTYTVLIYVTFNSRSFWIKKKLQFGCVKTHSILRSEWTSIVFTFLEMFSHAESVCYSKMITRKMFQTALLVLSWSPKSIME